MPRPCILVAVLFLTAAIKAILPQNDASGFALSHSLDTGRRFGWLWTFSTINLVYNVYEQRRAILHAFTGISSGRRATSLTVELCTKRSQMTTLCCRFSTERSLVKSNDVSNLSSATWACSNDLHELRYYLTTLRTVQNNRMVHSVLQCCQWFEVRGQGQGLKQRKGHQCLKCKFTTHK